MTDRQDEKRRLRTLYLFLCSLILIVVSTHAYALQDVNFTIDSSGLDLCLTADGLSNQVCDLNHSVVLDGRADHYLYFTPKQMITSNSTETTWNIVYNPIVYLFTGNGLYVVLFLMLFMYLFVRLMLR